MFKQIFYNEKQTQYIICDDGVIYNTKTHKNLYLNLKMLKRHTIIQERKKLFVQGNMI